MQISLPIITIFILLIGALPAQAGEEIIIGEVLGQPVNRTQISAEDPYDLHAELQEVFIEPILQQYYNKNRKEIEPNSREISLFMLYQQKLHEAELKQKKVSIHKRIEEITSKLQKNEVANAENDNLVAELYYLKTELEPPGHDYAMFVLPYWKMQVHLYKNFGGGRILWKQRGYEAFDAMLSWLRHLEKSGDLKIYDQKIKTTLYSYWRDQDHDQYLIKEKEKIQKEFLEPEWMRE